MVTLTCNCEKEITLTASIDYEQEGAAVLIDPDLQDPSELITELVAKWIEGYDIFYEKRWSLWGVIWLKSTTAIVLSRLISQMSHVPIPRNTGDFWLLDRRVA